MATSPLDALPDPPTSPPPTLPPLVGDLASLWRLHWEDDPLAPRWHPRGKYRFDAPTGEYPVTYGNRDRLACFLEVYGMTGVVAAGQGSRLLSHLSALRPLHLVPLDDPAARRRLNRSPGEIYIPHVGHHVGSIGASV